MVNIHDMEDLNATLEWTNKELKKSLIDFKYLKDHIQSLEEDVEYLELRLFELEKKRSLQVYRLEDEKMNGGM